MNALVRWWRSMMAPNPVGSAENHVTTEFLLGGSRLEIWRRCMKEAARMREAGVDEPWLRRYLEACKSKIASLHDRLDAS